ncbi:MAG: transposase [Dysgonamonadaceae bacterium]
MAKQYPDRRSVRLRGYDYSQPGLYFITLCTYNYKHLFGAIRNGEMILSEHGQTVHNCWLETELIRPNLTLGDFVVMPNHFHAVFAINNLSFCLNKHVITDECGNHMSDKYNLLLPPHSGELDSFLPPSSLQHGTSKTVGAIVRGFKSSVAKHLHATGFTDRLWQRNYHEHIIRNKTSLHRISKYIVSNPARWQDDCFYS